MQAGHNKLEGPLVYLLLIIKDELVRCVIANESLC